MTVESLRPTRRSFDALLGRLAGSLTTLTEEELLGTSHWNLGEDARLREDLRFRETPWGRWMRAEDLVANNAVYRWLHAERRGSVALDAALKRAGEVFGRRCVFCAADPRFVLRDEEVHLAASELSRQPVVEEKVGDLEKYRTHLPLHSLKAAAASEPAGEWGKRAQDEMIETLGWVRVSLPGRRLNERMFIAAIEGHSMDDGKSGLVDGGYAVFELWPSGTKQNLSVLVRGAFSDPETGNYAVKKYVADQRDEEGRHNKVSLVSLNPNKDRFPNIELQPEDDDDLTVVAKVVQALSTDDYERRPKAKRQAGRRDLTSETQGSKLARRISAFVDGAAPDGDDDDTSSLTGAGWATQLVCLEDTDGGVHLEVGPLDGLPGFVKKLRAVGNAWDALLLTANARARPARLPVKPGTGPWRWEAVGFEEDEDLKLDRLTLDAIDEAVPAVFRVDASGVGRRMKTTTLSPGQAYRLLLPPGLGATSPGVELGAGWRLWSLELTSPVSAPTVAALQSLGLEVGGPCPRLRWALRPPAAWRTSPRGDEYPVFEAGDEIAVRVTGLPTSDEKYAALFLHGRDATHRMGLSADGLVSLGAPPEGRWACALVPGETSVPPSTLMFEIATNVAARVDADFTVSADDGPSSLSITAPPGWPISLRWRGIREDRIGRVHAGADGVVTFDEMRPLLAERMKRSRRADLVVDLGELGQSVLPYDAGLTVAQVCQALSELWQQREGVVRTRAGAWLTLMPLWFQPVIELLGYGLEAFPHQPESNANEAETHGLAAWRLSVDERARQSITRSVSRILVLALDPTAATTHAAEWIDRACYTTGVREAIVTDGVRWTTHRRGNRLGRRVWDMGEVFGAEGQPEAMLADLAEGL